MAMFMTYLHTKFNMLGSNI